MIMILMMVVKATCWKISFAGSYPSNATTGSNWNAQHLSRPCTKSIWWNRVSTCFDHPKWCWHSSHQTKTIPVDVDWHMEGIHRWWQYRPRHMCEWFVRAIFRPSPRFACLLVDLPLSPSGESTVCSSVGLPMNSHTLDFALWDTANAWVVHHSWTHLDGYDGYSRPEVQISVVT